MTESPAEDQRAAQAQAAGEAAEARHMADAQAQHQASGSTVVAEQASTPDDTQSHGSVQVLTQAKPTSNRRRRQRSTPPSVTLATRPNGKGGRVVTDRDPPAMTPHQWIYLRCKGFGPAMALSRDAVYGSAWRKVRRLVLERDEWLCQIRGEGCLVRASEVDHRISWRDGGSVLDPENLRAACKRCNAARGGVLGASRGALDRFSAQRRPSREW